MKKLYAASLAIILLSSCFDPSPENLEFSDAQSFVKTFDSLQVAGNLSLPYTEFQSIGNFTLDLEPELKKKVFIRVLLPVILDLNKQIDDERNQLLSISKKEVNKLSESEKSFLEDLFAKYQVNSKNIKILLTKVDRIPPSLVIAQAAIESAWGSSRFASEGNSLFGQQTSSDNPDDYIQAFSSGTKLRKFKSLRESISSYMLNLNSHNAYREFRKIRKNKSGENLSSIDLLTGLVHYSERGNDYLLDLENLINSNNLRQYDLRQLNTKQIYFCTFTSK